MNIELGKNIDTRELETKIQKFWDENHFWDNDVESDKKSFCVMMPPPNVTGNLHMGHALEILKRVRGLRTERKIGNGAKLETLTIPGDTPEVLHGLIKSAARAEKIVLGKDTDFVVAQNNG